MIIVFLSALMPRQNRALSYEEFMQFPYTTILKFQIQNSGVSFAIYFS